MLARSHQLLSIFGLLKPLLHGQIWCQSVAVFQNHGVEKPLCISVSYIINCLIVLSKVDCTWTSWTAWDSCDVTCGGGTQSRSRVQDAPAENGGADCLPADATETQDCNTNCCPGEVE